MEGYEWTFLQKNVDFGDCGRWVLVMSSLLTYLLPSVTMTTVYHLLKYVILAFPFSPFSKTRFNWTVQYSEDPELNSVI